MTLSPLVRQSLGIATFTLVGVMALGWSGARAAQAARQTHALQRSLVTTHGWAQAAPRLEDALTRWHAHQPGGMASPPALWASQRLQQATTQAGVQVLSVRPTAEGLKASVAGSAAQVETFLQILPQWLPGLTLTQVELDAQEPGIECRLELTVPPPPSEVRP